MSKNVEDTPYYKWISHQINKYTDLIKEDADNQEYKDKLIYYTKELEMVKKVS